MAGGWPAILTRNFQISAAGIAAPLGLQVCHTLKFSYKYYRGIIKYIANNLFILIGYFLKSNTGKINYIIIFFLKHYIYYILYMTNKHYINRIEI